MAVVGFGTDIVEIERIEKVLQRTGEAFARRILSDPELVQYQSLKNQQRFLAKRFAAKEAAAKALGTGIAGGVTFHDFIVSNDERGKPCLQLAGKALQLAQDMGVGSVFISIADERHYALASVIFDNQ